MSRGAVIEQLFSQAIEVSGIGRKADALARVCDVVSERSTSRRGFAFPFFSRRALPRVAAGGALLAEVTLNTACSGTQSPETPTYSLDYVLHHLPQLEQNGTTFHVQGYVQPRQEGIYHEDPTQNKPGFVDRTYIFSLYNQQAPTLTSPQVEVEYVTRGVAESAPAIWGVNPPPIEQTLVTGKVVRPDPHTQYRRIEAIAKGVDILTKPASSSEQAFTQMQFDGFDEVFNTVAQRIGETDFQNTFYAAANVTRNNREILFEGDTTIATAPQLRSDRLRNLYYQEQETIRNNAPQFAANPNTLTLLSLLYAYMGSYTQLYPKGSHLQQQDTLLFGKVDEDLASLRRGDGKTTFVGFIADLAAAYNKLTGQQIHPQIHEIRSQRGPTTATFQEMNTNTGAVIRNNGGTGMSVAVSN